MKKLAFIDLSNYNNWPTGGILEYEKSILKYIIQYYDVELWGVSVDGVVPEPVELNGEIYQINIFTNVHTRRKLIPNYLHGFDICYSKKFASEKYDIIYSHSASSFVGAKLNRFHHRDAIFAYHQHGLSYRTNYDLMVRIQKPFYWIAQREADIVFIVSGEESAKAYIEEMKYKSRAIFVRIGSPIDLSKFNLSNIKRRINNMTRLQSFIYVGRLSKEKNVCNLIEVYAKYIQLSSNKARLKLIGDGPERENVEAIIKKNGLEELVDLMGNFDHESIYDELENSNAFIITSHGEGVSIAVLEAFASGLPVVCYKVPGLEEQNIDGVTGQIVDKDNIEDFAKAMIRVENNIKEYSYNCLQEVEKYRDSLVADKIIKAIDRVKEAKLIC